MISTVAIDFYDRQRVAVRCTTSFDDRALGELSLWCLFCLRTLGNLGRSQASQQLAEILLHNPSDIWMFVGDDFSNRPESVHYEGDAKRRFTAQFEIAEKPHFDYQALGFGFLGWGLGYYAPLACAFFAKELLRQRRKDDAYASKLKKIGRRLAAVDVGVANQVPIFMSIMAEVTD